MGRNARWCRGGQRRFIARRVSEGIRYHAAKLCAIVGQGRGREGVARRSRAGDVDHVSLPLITEWRTAAGGDNKGCRLPLRHCLIRWLRGDAGRGAAAAELNSEYGRQADREIVKAAIVRDLKIDRVRGRRRETGCRVIRWIKNANPTVTVISKKVFADVTGWKLDRGGIVKSAARDCAAFRTQRTVAIPKDRATEIRIRSWTFRGRPAVIRSRNTVIDFFPGALAHVVDEHARGAGLKREREWIAQTQRPNRSIDSSGGVEEWIVCRNRAVGIYAQHFP